MGARPLLDKDVDGPAPDSQSPSAPETGPPCRPRRLTAPRAPQPQPRPGRTRGAHPGSAGRTRYARGCIPGPPVGGVAERCAPPRSAGALDTKASTARSGRGRGTARSGRPKAGAGWRRVPRTPRPFSECPRGLRWPGAAHPSLAAQRGAAAPAPSLEVDPGPREGRPPGLVALSRAPQPPPPAPRHEPPLPKNQAGVEAAQGRGGQEELQ